MRHVLYVEDDPVNAFVMRKFLEKDFAFMHLEEGEHAIEYVQQHPVDLLLLDINLGRGRKDGVETMLDIRKLPQGQSMPMVAITAYAMPEDRQRFLSLGFDAYVPKPVERDEIIKLIRKFFSDDR